MVDPRASSATKHDVRDGADHDGFRARRRGWAPVRANDGNWARNWSWHNWEKLQIRAEMAWLENPWWSRAAEMETWRRGRSLVAVELRSGEGWEYDGDARAPELEVHQWRLRKVGRDWSLTPEMKNSPWKLGRGEATRWWGRRRLGGVTVHIEKPRRRWRHRSGTQWARTRVQRSEVLWSLYLGRTLERTCNAGRRSRAHLMSISERLSETGCITRSGEDKYKKSIGWQVISGLTRFTSTEPGRIWTSYE